LRVLEASSVTLIIVLTKNILKDFQNAL
jgi:hypothetical protein